MWDVRACRSCLAVKGKLEKIGEASKRQYTAITGLQISDDGYPTYFCLECRHHIKKSLAFRRKSRRAHFVLKEIMAVRKQISYSDIVTVNRKKTNLESSLNYWEPNNNACYLIDNQEAEDDMQKYKLAPLPLNYTKMYSTHLVDIEPEAVETIETPVETNEPTEVKEDDFNEEDIPSNDYLETEDTANIDIDMNDIFKDLEVNEPDYDDELEEITPKKSKAKKKLHEERDELSRVKLAVRKLVEILTMFNIKVLSLEEQKDRFEMRKRLPPFVTAYFKCAVCLTVHTTMQELMEHVGFHNKRKFDHECEVCKNKLPTVDDLDAHMANYHMYEYECLMCKGKLYSQTDAVRHITGKHGITEPQSGTLVQKKKQKAVDALKMFKISGLTQEMMREIMKLESCANGLEEEETGQTDTVSLSEKTNWVKCDVCGIWMKERQDLEKHMTLKHRFMYTCKFCKEVFTTRKQALEHAETHAPYECGDCGKIFDNNTKFRKHRNLAHIENKSIPCNLCGHTARHEKLFYKHQLRQHGYISLNDPLIGDPEYKCEECGVQFVDKRSLETHLVNTNHKGADSIELACVPCKKLFEDADQRETHYITCIYSRRYPRNCCYCSEVLNNAVEYKSHYFRQHPTLPYRYVTGNCICDVCGKSVHRPQLEAHLRSHSSGAGGPASCRLCRFTSPHPARLVAHVLACHAHRPYLCALCPHRFKYRFNCKRHVLKVHAPTKLFKCDFCDMEFSYYHNLKEHSQTLHNLVIPPLKSSFPLQSKHKFYVYTHMRIEINEMERPIVEKTNIELVDYLELKSKPVDYKNYFVFNPDVQENVYFQKKDKKKKKVKQTELEEAIAQIKPEGAYDINECNEPIEEYDDDMKDEKMEVDTEEMKIDEVQSEVLEKAESVDGKVESEVSVEPCEVNELPSEEALPLEVIESEGHQYVMIDGEMYRIACEDEE